MLIICLWVSLAILCTGGTGHRFRTQYKLQARGREQTNFVTRRVLDLRHSPAPRRQAERAPEYPPQLRHTHFCPMPEMEQHGATLVNEDDYPWVARVIHGHHKNQVLEPLICTAAAIKRRVFITAARCIVTAKALYTTILYKHREIGVKAFIFPAIPSKQMFDDVGLIVVWDPWGQGSISYAGYLRFSEVPRPDDDSYDFFEKFTTESPQNLTVIGFINNLEGPPGTQELYRLDNMHASNRVCNEIYPVPANPIDYQVPCVHSCTVEQHNRGSEACRRSLLGLGHVVVNLETQQLIAVVTWTCANSAADRRIRNELPMPLGLAVPNKRTFLDKDRQCAINLTQDEDTNHTQIVAGYHWKICSHYYQ